MLAGRALPTLLLAASLFAPVESLDWKFQRRVQTERSPALDPIVQGLTDAARPQVVTAVLLAVSAFGGPAGSAIARHALYALIPTNLVVEVTKRIVDRHRPEGPHKHSNASFPSGHAANAIALAWVLSWHWRRWAPLLWALALAVSWSRIYLNRHFLSDVLCGAIIGLVMGWIVTREVERRYGTTGRGRRGARGGPSRTRLDGG